MELTSLFKPRESIPACFNFSFAASWPVSALTELKGVRDLLNPLQCSCLENPRDGGGGWADIYGVAQSRTQLKWLSCRALLWTRLWLKRMLCDFIFYTDHYKFLNVSNKAVLFYHSYVHCSSTFNFLQKLSLCIHNLPDCLVKEASFLAYTSFQHAFPH